MAKRLLLLNGLAALAVPIFHSVITGLNMMILWTKQLDQIGGVSYYTLIALRQWAGGFAIPAFIFVTGYFMAFLSRGKVSRLTWSTVLKRVGGLVVPFLLWTTVHFILLQKVPNSVHDVLRPYYYVLLVAQFYALAIWLVPAVKKNWKAVLLAALALHLVLHILYYFGAFGLVRGNWRWLLRLTPIYFFPRRIFWFVFGIVVSLKLKEIRPFLVRIRPWLVVVAVVAGIGSVLEYDLVDKLTGPEWMGTEFNGLVREFYAGAILLSFVAFDKIKMPFSKQISKVGAQSMGMYLVNDPAIFVISALIYHFARWITGYQVIYQPIMMVTGIGVPLLAMWLWKKLPFRKSYALIFG